MKFVQKSIALALSVEKSSKTGTKEHRSDPISLVFYSDLIFTGTPPGVDLGMTPPVYLRNGDEVTLAIEWSGMA